MRRWTISRTPPRSGAVLTHEQIAASRLAPDHDPVDPRPWLAARVVACRTCEHVGRGGQSCAACDIRCAHPRAISSPPLIAERPSTCPAGRWPLLA